jgi:hypothetical protein
MCCQRDTPPATRHQYVTAIRDTVDELDGLAIGFALLEDQLEGKWADGARFVTHSLIHRVETIREALFAVYMNGRNQ